MKRKEILEVYKAGPEAVVKPVSSLCNIIEKLTEEIAELKERIKVLEDRLGQNSANSNKPPSTDWPTKKRSLRGKSSRSAGGQKGHKGYNLKMVEVADHTTIHKVSTCSKCGSSLKDIVPTSYRKRQVFDLPLIKVNVEEHRAELDSNIRYSKYFF